MTLLHGHSPFIGTVYCSFLLALFATTATVSSASVRSPVNHGAINSQDDNFAGSRSAVAWDSATPLELYEYERGNSARLQREKQGFVEKRPSSYEERRDKTCDASEFVAVAAPKQNPFLPLTVDEVGDVEKWLYDGKDFNLTKFDNATTKYVPCLTIAKSWRADVVFWRL